MNTLIVMCLFGGGVFLVTFVGNTIREVIKQRKQTAAADDKENEV